MVSAQHSPNALVADVKIFDPETSRNSSYIKQGFHQVYRYLHDFNQPIGYLVVFKGSEKQLQVNADATPSENIPYLSVGDKTIFLVQIDIFPHDQSASKRPIPEIEIISGSELRSEIESN